MPHAVTSQADLDAFEKSGSGLRLSIEMDASVAAGRATVPIDEMIAFLTSVSGDSEKNIYEIVASQFKRSLIEAKERGVMEVPIRIEEGWGKCGSCYTRGGGRGQMHYDNIGGSQCFPC
jgi:hypothetical protein